MKAFYTQDNIGKVAYTVSFHDGVKTHGDGSPFFDLRTFRNRVERDACVKELRATGYTEVSGAAQLTKELGIPKGKVAMVSLKLPFPDLAKLKDFLKSISAFPATTKVIEDALLNNLFGQAELGDDAPADGFVGQMGRGQISDCLIGYTCQIAYTRDPMNKPSDTALHALAHIVHDPKHLEAVFAALYPLLKPE